MMWLRDVARGFAGGGACTSPLPPDCESPRHGTSNDNSPVQNHPLLILHRTATTCIYPDSYHCTRRHGGSIVLLVLTAAMMPKRRLDKKILPD